MRTTTNSVQRQVRAIVVEPMGGRRTMLQRVRCCAAVLAVCALVACHSTTQLPPAVPAPAQHAGWEDTPLPTKRPTRYTPTMLDGRAVIQADADNAVSLYRRRVHVEPSELGRLSFSWMVPELIATADLSRAEAEDAPVRIVLAFDGDHSKLSFKNRMLFDLLEAVAGETPPYATLMYVWDNRAPLESVITAGRTDRIRKIVVDSGPAQTAIWRLHERDIASDFRRAFGEEPGALISIALMTDSDNTRSTTRAYYGEIRLVGAHGQLQ